MAGPRRLVLPRSLHGPHAHGRTPPALGRLLPLRIGINGHRLEPRRGLVAVLRLLGAQILRLDQHGRHLVLPRPVERTHATGVGRGAGRLVLVRRLRRHGDRLTVDQRRDPPFRTLRRMDPHRSDRSLHPRSHHLRREHVRLLEHDCDIDPGLPASPQPLLPEWSRWDALPVALSGDDADDGHALLRALRRRSE